MSQSTKPVIPVADIEIRVDMPLEMCSNKPQKKKINSRYLSDYDNSMFLKEESLFIVATPAEIHLYDAITLERLQVYIPKNVKNTDIISLMRENVKGLESKIYILLQ